MASRIRLPRQASATMVTSRSPIFFIVADVGDDVGALAEAGGLFEKGDDGLADPAAAPGVGDDGDVAIADLLLRDDALEDRRMRSTCALDAPFLALEPGLHAVHRAPVEVRARVVAVADCRRHG